MSHFVTLIRYTQQGAAKIKESQHGSTLPKRLQRIELKVSPQTRQQPCSGQKILSHA
jgi:uncharacterized protein with GYD domain